MSEQAGNLTFAIIKPDAVRGGDTGSIIQRIIDGGFQIRALKMLHMTLKEAEGFYAVHRERPFFAGLTEFMSSGPCVVLVLQKEGAVKVWRDLMGATDPAKADAGTIRKEFGSSVGENATHGSDSDENAAIEIAYFFSQIEIV
ncbi:MAG: nucleoside-diphosphate kinase [Pyrinomonadaceae bacterium]